MPWIFSGHMLVDALKMFKCRLRSIVCKPGFSLSSLRHFSNLYGGGAGGARRFVVLRLYCFFLYVVARANIVPLVIT